jgi:glycerol-3-phosphate acyltransferase PlsY
MVAASFFIGAIPWGYLIGKRTKGIDLRTVGSGGTGATNVLRSVGKGASAAVFALDFLKGVAPVLLARWLGFSSWWVAAAAVAAVAGHCWSPFIAFKGGKGVATGAGAAAALFPPVLVILPITLGIVWLSKYVSLGSLVTAVLAVILAAVGAVTGHLAVAWAVAITLMAAIIVVRHSSNIQRLLQGTERRIGETVPV